MIFVAAFLVAVLTFFLVLLLLTYVRKKISINIFHRLRRHTSEDVLREKDGGIVMKMYALIQRIAKPFTGFSITQFPETKLRQAGIPLLGAEFILIVILFASLAFLSATMLTLNPQLGIAAALIVPLIFWLILLVLISRRRDAFTEQLSDCLTTVANALRAGYSFQQAVEVIAKDMEPPISEEFAHVGQDVSMGINLDDALEQMARRVESSDFDLVVTAVLIQREVGGNLAQVLDSISDTIIERIRMKREINALTAQGRMSAMVLLALPFAVGAFMYFANHDQFIILFEEPLGQMALVASVIMEIIGILVIRKIVDIDV